MLSLFKSNQSVSVCMPNILGHQQDWIKARKLTDTYIPCCEDCCLMPEDEQFKGYDSHKGFPYVLYSGNLTYDNVFTDSMDKIQLDSKEYSR